MSANKREVVDQNSYVKVLEEIKNDIQLSQLRAALSVTKELTMLYWRIGKMLSEKIAQAQWGTKTTERLAADLKISFPNVEGFSVRNLKFMRQFAESYSIGIWETAVSQIPWGHNIILMQKLHNIDKRLWYAQQTIVNGWSRSMLQLWINSNLYEREGKSINNFKQTLPSYQSDLVEQTLKDPYNFSFLSLDKKHREEELEHGLVNHMQKFLMELGQGFSFVGRQYKIEVGNKDYFIDLLFYHLKLRCFVVIELKAAEFDPRDAGQINFYLSAVDDLLRHPDDKPSIGLLLCKTKDKFTAEYALRDIKKPIGIAEYETKLVESLPKNLKSSLPTIEEIESELSRNEMA